MGKPKPKGAFLWYKGVTYRSKLEVEVVKLLYQARKLLGKSFDFKYESEGIPYILPERMYVPDFVIERSDGSVVYVEVKGYLDNDATRKMRAVKTCNPDKTFVFLFSKDNPIRKGAKMTYSGWAEKNGFDWSIGSIPERWLKIMADIETITISKSEHERLLERDDWLQCMEACGVDNWQGIDDAIKMFNGEDDG